MNRLKIFRLATGHPRPLLIDKPIRPVVTYVQLTLHASYMSHSFVSRHKSDLFI